MPELLIDILNDKNNVLHVFPVAIDRQGSPGEEARAEQAALEAAAAAEIVPTSEAPKLKARRHVSRGGQLLPYGDAIQVKAERELRLEAQIRERAYFLWQEAGYPDHQADAFWHRAREIQDAMGYEPS
jgi:hypothetical protein